MYTTCCLMVIHLSISKFQRYTFYNISRLSFLFTISLSSLSHSLSLYNIFGVFRHLLRGTYFLITYRLCKTFLHKLISAIFCSFCTCVIIYYFIFYIFVCVLYFYVRRGRLMVPRVKKTPPSPLGTL